MTDTITSVGFKPLDSTIHPRIIMALSGPQRFGKTHFALTTPGPIAYFNIDMGDEGVTDKFADQKKIYNFPMDVPTGDNMQEIARESWASFVPAYDLALKEMRSIVIDTASELWEILRIARFGKLTEIMPYQYTPVNAEFKDLFHKAKHTTSTNVIFLHRVKVEYANNQPTGNLVPAWYNKTAYEVQLVGTMRRYERNVDEGREATEFRLFIDDSRHNASLINMELPGIMSNFPAMAQTVIPKSKPEDWI